MQAKVHTGSQQRIGVANLPELLENSGSVIQDSVDPCCARCWPKTVREVQFSYLSIVGRTWSAFQPQPCKASLMTNISYGLRTRHSGPTHFFLETDSSMHKNRASSWTKSAHLDTEGIFFRRLPVQKYSCTILNDEEGMRTFSKRYWPLISLSTSLAISIQHHDEKRTGIQSAPTRYPQEPHGCRREQHELRRPFLD